MKIPVVIVDDNDTDRYVCKRYFGRVDDFDELIEIDSGDRFLDKYYDEKSQKSVGAPPILVLMDVNMPGRDGFETALETQQRMNSGKGEQSLVIMMYTSSDNEKDKQRADSIDIIKGFITKPVDANRANDIRDLYLSLL